MQVSNNRNRQPVTKHQQNTPMQSSQMRSSSSGVTILICLLASGIASTNAVPTDSIGGSIICNGQSVGAARIARDVAAGLMQSEELPKEVISTETTAAEQPQGQCLLDGVLVMETNVSCEKQVGCRAIQKTGHCCPDYKCDCEKDGKTYVNGDKLVDPETPCTVCYCQGGEILCSSVTCFHRDDCNPKYIPGRCCPIYDNCPVSIFDPNHNVEKTTPTATTAAPEKPPATQQLQLNPKITIKEITRPIEIRITDDNKAIPIHQMLKPSTTSSTTTTTAAPISTTTAALLPTNAISTTSDAYGESHTSNNNGESTIATASAAAFSVDNHRQTLIPVGGINTENSLKLSASVAYPSTERAPAPIPQQQQQQQQYSTAAPYISTEAETSPEFGVAKHTHVDVHPAVPVFGTQVGLQRVDAEALSDPTKVNIKRENIATTERVRVSANPVAAEDFSSSELIYAQQSSTHDGENIALHTSAIDLEPDTAGSDNIYHIILTTTGPRAESSADNYHSQQSFSTTEGILAQQSVLLTVSASPASPTIAKQSQHTTDAPAQSSVGATQQSAAATTPATPNSTTANESASTMAMESSSTPEPSRSSTYSAHHMEEEDAAIPVEANPAYPSLPEDDFSLRDVNFPLSEIDDAVESEVKDEPRSITHNFNLANGTSSSSNAEEGSGNGADINILLHSVEHSTSTTDSASSTTENAPNLHVKVALLMNSAEDISGETAISNSSDFQLDRLAAALTSAENKTDSEESLEAQLSSETGSGSGELNTETRKDKRREPTTARPTQHLNLDIDELGSASGDGKSDTLEDPKLDAESIKAEEHIEEGIIKQEIGQKEDVLTVNTNAAQERTLEEVVVPVIDSGVNGRAQRLFLQRFN